jgi:hypothetical protein
LSTSSGALTGGCPKIDRSPPPPAMTAGSVMIDWFIYIYLFRFVWVMLPECPQLRAAGEILPEFGPSHLFLRERRVEVSKKVLKFER